MGVQEEFLNKFESCLEWYHKAYSTIENNPNTDPKLRENFKKVNLMHKQLNP
jgi:hypothetical protein